MFVVIAPEFWGGMNGFSVKTADIDSKVIFVYVVRSDRILHLITRIRRM